MSSAFRFQQSVRRTEVWLRSDTNLVKAINTFVVFVFVVIIFSKYPYCHVDATCTFIPKEKGKFCVCNDGFNGNSTKKVNFVFHHSKLCFFYICNWRHINKQNCKTNRQASKKQTDYKPVQGMAFSV